MTNRKQYQLRSDEEEKKKIRDSVWASLFSKGRPKTVRDIGLKVIEHLPTRLNMVQGFMRSVNWKAAQRDVLEKLNNTIVIVGLPNTREEYPFQQNQWPKSLSCLPTVRQYAYVSAC